MLPTNCPTRPAPYVPDLEVYMLRLGGASASDSSASNCLLRICRGIPMAKGLVHLVGILGWISRKILFWRVSISMDGKDDRPSLL